jgi:hypothetical protein
MDDRGIRALYLTLDCECKGLHSVSVLKKSPRGANTVNSEPTASQIHREVTSVLRKLYCHSFPLLPE